MSFKIEAKGDYVFAEPSDTGADSMFAKVDNQQKQQYLKVVAVGEDVTRCKVGDNILPYGQQFQAFAFEGKQIIVLQNDQVMGKFNV